MGSGRTEIAETLFGIRRAVTGSVHIDGKTLKATSPQAAIAGGIVYVPEDRAKHGIFAEMSVAANITAVTLERLRRFGRMLSRRVENESAGRVRDDLGIRVAETSRPIKTLSGVTSRRRSSAGGSSFVQR